VLCEERDAGIKLCHTRTEVLTALGTKLFIKGPSWQMAMALLFISLLLLCAAFHVAAIERPN
jgi:hypothetical protein